MSLPWKKKKNARQMRGAGRVSRQRTRPSRLSRRTPASWCSGCFPHFHQDKRQGRSECVFFAQPDMIRFASRGHRPQSLARSVRPWPAGQFGRGPTPDARSGDGTSFPGPGPPCGHRRVGRSTQGPVSALVLKSPSRHTAPHRASQPPSATGLGPSASAARY